MSATQVSSTSEIVLPIDDPESGYSVLRSDKIPGPPSGAVSVPHYDTIKLNFSIKQQNSDGDMSHLTTKSTLTGSPSHS